MRDRRLLGWPASGRLMGPGRGARSQHCRQHTNLTARNGTIHAARYPLRAASSHRGRTRNRCCQAALTARHSAAVCMGSQVGDQRRHMHTAWWPLGIAPLAQRIHPNAMSLCVDTAQRALAPHVLRPRDLTMWYLFELQAVAPRDEQRSTFAPYRARHCAKYFLKAAHHLAPLRS